MAEDTLQLSGELNDFEAEDNVIYLAMVAAAKRNSETNQNGEKCNDQATTYGNTEVFPNDLK